MNRFMKDEDGWAIVEATLLLPFCIIMIIALFYAAVFMCQKANMQANVQNALIYYKNVETDTYIDAKSNIEYSGGSGSIEAAGSSFGNVRYRFPYRFFVMKSNSGGFESFFRSMYQCMFFDSGKNVQFNVEKHNYVIYKEIIVTATQTVRPAINLAMVGGSNSIDIIVTGKVVVTNGDSLIRNVDFIIDIVSQTAIGEKAREFVGKAVEFYNKFKTKFNVTNDED